MVYYYFLGSRVALNMPAMNTDPLPPISLQEYNLGTAQACLFLAIKCKIAATCFRTLPNRRHFLSIPQNKCSALSLGCQHDSARICREIAAGRRAAASLLLSTSAG